MIGIDIVEIKRFHRINKKSSKYWEKYFTKNELEYCFKSPKKSERLAGIFSAKEAIIKALGKKYLGKFDLIEIIHTRDGKPVVKLKGNKKNIEISISHDKEYAIAVAMSS